VARDPSHRTTDTESTEPVLRYISAYSPASMVRSPDWVRATGSNRNMALVAGALESSLGLSAYCATTCAVLPPPMANVGVVPTPIMNRALEPSGPLSPADSRSQAGPAQLDGVPGSRRPSAWRGRCATGTVASAARIQVRGPGNQLARAKKSIQYSRATGNSIRLSTIVADRPDDSASPSNNPRAARGRANAGRLAAAPPRRESS